MKRPTQLWVDPEFKKAFKRLAASKDMSMTELSEELSQSGDPFCSLEKGFKRDKKKTFAKW